MNHWLLKTEPGAYSWDDLVRDGRATWDGITNPVALKNMRGAQAGDTVVIYHTGSERRALGLARITRGPYADPKKKDPKLVVVDIVPVEPLPTPVTLQQIKADRKFAGWDLLRLSRLSFVPVPEPFWQRLMELAGAR
jgi:predicted RNA-binding protein with PUA-like domain